MSICFDTSSTVAADEQKLPPIVVESAQLIAQAILPDTFKGDASNTNLKAFLSSLSLLNKDLEKFGMQGQILTNNGPLKKHKAITNSKMANHCTFDYNFRRSKVYMLYCKCCMAVGDEEICLVVIGEASVTHTECNQESFSQDPTKEKDMTINKKKKRRRGVVRGRGKMNVIRRIKDRILPRRRI